MKNCRGCAGTGIGHHVTPREIQLIGAGFRMVADGGQIATLAVVARSERTKGRLQLEAPLAEVLQTVKDREKRGYECEEAPPDPKWACSWCGGTGKPSLSVPELERMMEART